MKTSELELDQQTHELIKSFCVVGDKLSASQLYSEALTEYNKAWAIVPDPKNEWEAATWILAAIADTCYLGGFKKSAREALQYAMTCPGAIGNPFLHLRYGQVLYDAGELDAAADELIRAYMGAGADIFAVEDEKYLNFLGTRAKL